MAFPFRNFPMLWNLQTLKLSRKQDFPASSCMLRFCFTPWMSTLLCWIKSLQWRHNERDDVSNHQPHNGLLNGLFTGPDQRKHQSPASLAFVRGIHRWPVNWPVTQKMFPFDVVIMVFHVFIQETPVAVGEFRYNLRMKTPFYVRNGSYIKRSSKCRWSIYRTSRKRRGTLRVAHKVLRSSSTVWVGLRFGFIHRCTPRWISAKFDIFV